MTNVLYTPLWTQHFSLEDISRMLSPDYVVDDEPLEGIRLSRAFLVPEQPQDQGNVATYARFASQLREDYSDASLFGTSFDPGAVFRASFTTDEQKSLYLFSVTPVSSPHDRTVVLELRVTEKDAVKAYQATLEAVQNDVPRKMPDARTADTDARLLRKLREFLEG